MCSVLRRPRPASTKPVACRYWPSMPGIGTAEIRRGDKLAIYTVRERRVDPKYGGGRGFRLQKVNEFGPAGKSIDCYVASEPAESTCDCEDKIFNYDPAHPCKHLIALRDLVESGEIDKEDPEMPWHNQSTCSPTAPAPVQEVAPVAGGPSVIRLACPVCGESAEVRPARGKRYPYEFHCRECVERAEAAFANCYCHEEGGAA